MIDGKKIGIDARMIEMSGIGTYIQHLMGQGIYDYAFGDEEEIRRYDSEVSIIPFSAVIYGPKEQLRFPSKEFRSCGIDLMHFPHYNVPASFRGSYVVTVHDLTHIIFPQFMGNKFKSTYAKMLMSRALRNARHVFTVSNNSKDDIVRIFGTDQERITITYNAIDSDFVVKDPTELDYLYDRFSIPRDKKTVLYVGNLKPHKNLQTLLQAFVRMNRSDVVLILAGKAFKAIDLEQKEEELGIASQVIHTGLVSKNELVDLYNIADLFAFPSLYEGFGIPPLEAMACGTPVVAANNSSIPEVVGDAALLVDGLDIAGMASAIDELIDDEDKCRGLVKRGMARVSMFSWDDTVRRVKQILSQTLLED